MAMRKKRFGARTIWRIIEIVGVTTATVVLFHLAKDAAFAERGYEAIGGEYCVLLLPLFWIAGKKMLKDFVSMLVYIKEARDED